MKKCSYCGQQYPDEANTCAKDGQALVVAPERIASPPPIPLTPGTGRKKYRTYNEVPWYRREPGFLVLIFALFCTPVVLALCLICLTGDVYKNDYDNEDNLKVWGIGNKIAAVLILLLQAFTYWVLQQMK